jgi:hypothetical protein
MLLGLSGYAQSGKDTVAKVLINEYGFIRIAFADIIRTSLYTLDPIVAVDESAQPIRLKEKVDSLGWDKAKLEPEIRRLLQIFGTEIGRTLLGPDIWVNLALAQIQDEKDYVITDVRFPNEAAAIKERDGSLWRVSRPTITAVNQHLSEKALAEYQFDAYINNDQDLAHLHQHVKNLLGR